MPASNPSDVVQTEAAILAAVRRLSRPDGNGDMVIERAAIVAEGTRSAAIEAWVIDNGGRPEAAKSDHPATALHEFPGRMTAVGRQAPRRYVLASTALRPTS